MNRQKAISLAPPHTDVSISVSCMLFYALYPTALQKGAYLRLSAQLAFMRAEKAASRALSSKIQPRTQKRQVHTQFVLLRVQTAYYSIMT